MRSAEPLVLSSGSSVDWRNQSYLLPVVATSRGCGWSSNDSDAWVGVGAKLMRLHRQGAQDTLFRTDFAMPRSQDTVLSIAVTSTAVWGVVPRGVYRRGLVGSDTLITVDTALFGGQRMTGLKSGAGASLWAGIEGEGHQYGKSFSTQGLRRYNGTSWISYRAALSSVLVPSDTIWALGIRDTGSVWIAARSGFYRFSASGGFTKVADTPVNGVYDLAGSGEGFYAGTPDGFYQFRNDSLILLGNPAVALRPAIAAKRPEAGPRLRVLTAQEARDFGNARSVTGQRVGSRAADGVYIVPPESR
jgi:hypothetical protein